MQETAEEEGELDMRLQKSKPHPELDKLLELAKCHVMTPTDAWDQRVSFVHGQLMDCAPDVTREQVQQHAAEIYGPRPKE